MPLTDVELAELRAIINEPSSFVFYKALMEGVLERLDAAEQVITVSWVDGSKESFDAHSAWLKAKGE